MRAVILCRCARTWLELVPAWCAALRLQLLAHGQRPLHEARPAAAAGGGLAPRPVAAGRRSNGRANCAREHVRVRGAAGARHTHRNVRCSGRGRGALRTQLLAGAGWRGWCRECRRKLRRGSRQGGHGRGCLLARPQSGGIVACRSRPSAPGRREAGARAGVAVCTAAIALTAFLCQCLDEVLLHGLRGRACCLRTHAVAQGCRVTDASKHACRPHCR